MSKIIAALVATGGASVAVVGGTYLMNRDGGTNDEGSEGKVQDESTFSSTPAISADLGFTDLTGFKGKKGGDCAKKYFPDLDYSLGEQIDNSSHSITASDLTATETEDGHPKSCLVINWERSDSQNSTPPNTDGKWTGGFRWLWTFVNGDKGFVMFYTTKLSEADNKFDLEGGIYFVAKEGDDTNKTWKIKKRKEENGTSKSIDQTNFGTSFPQNADNFDGLDDSHKTNWGFVSGSNDLTKLCKKGVVDCPKDPKEVKPAFKAVWKWEVSSETNSTTPDKWSKTFNTSLTNLFGADGLSMTNVFDTFKGSWKKQTSPSQ